MRIDKFLNAVNITKRRSIAEDMLQNKVIQINNTVVKKSKEVKVGDIISVHYLDYIDEFQVLQIPTTKTTPKSHQSMYVKKLN